MNLNEEVPEEIVLLTNCFNEFVNIGLVSKFNNPFTDITEDGIIQFKKLGRSAEYSVALDECMKLFKEFMNDNNTSSITETVLPDHSNMQPIQVPPIDYIKARIRVSAEELYKVYNLNTRSERTIFSNTLCRNATGVNKVKSNGKLYFIYKG